ncbi:MAG: NADPH-dependent F420 reductase [Chloroflexi bacterium RBG_16_52_11]|nr:MAG: NADPH-dependent F420 reductase [Chloroflexi bacterium RBG_16_52_11]
MSDSETLSLPTLAILGGTGKEGPGLALRWANAGYPVVIGSRLAERARSTADELNAILGIDTIRGMENSQAAMFAQICVLTVGYTAHQPALESLKQDLRGKILVDATARVDFRNPLPPAPPSAGRMAQDLLGPQVRVVAAFQNVPAHTLRRNLGKDLDLDVLICSDDIAAAEEVIPLARAAGMRGYYAGGLDNALVIEGITSVLISLNEYYKVKNASISITGLQVE